MKEKVNNEIFKKIKPGSVTVVVDGQRAGGEPDEVTKTLNSINKWKDLKGELMTWDKESLENEYRRINSDFDLSMRNKEKLQAILSVLVEKYHITNEEYSKLQN